MKMLVALVSGVLLSTAAVAQHEHGASTGGSHESAVESGEASANEADDTATSSTSGTTERVICRRMDRTATRTASDRVCMTARQWREHNRRN